MLEIARFIHFQMRGTDRISGSSKGKDTANFLPYREEQETPDSRNSRANKEHLADDSSGGTCTENKPRTVRTSQQSGNLLVVIENSGTSSEEATDYDGKAIQKVCDDISPPPLCVPQHHTKMPTTRCGVHNDPKSDKNSKYYSEAYLGRVINESVTFHINASTVEDEPYEGTFASPTPDLTLEVSPESECRHIGIDSSSRVAQLYKQSEHQGPLLVTNIPHRGLVKEKERRSRSNYEIPASSLDAVMDPLSVRNLPRTEPPPIVYSEV